MGFYDFAGSTLVHSGRWLGRLGCILVLGPRKGKYVDGQIRPILPSNLPLAAIGVFLLWFGWFGFNGGSELAPRLSGSATSASPPRSLLPWVAWLAVSLAGSSVRSLT